MKKGGVAEKIAKLRGEIEEHNRRYYLLDDPIISDAARGSGCWATWVTCGSFTPCGPGWGYTSRPRWRGPGPDRPGASAPSRPFVAIGAGALGAVGAGFIADRRGRARVAAWAMMVSATCCALTVPAFHAPFAVLLLLVAVWGFSVVADSAQFSAIVSETTDDEYLGTALTVQTCLGFLLTMVSIRLTSAAAQWVGWQWAFLLILPGPMLGVQAMLALMKPRIREE